MERMDDEGMISVIGILPNIKTLTSENKRISVGQAFSWLHQRHMLFLPR